MSVPSNIAEGMSRKGNKEKIQFLCISLGSCAELRTQLTIAEQVGYLSAHEKQNYLNQCNKIAKMINSLKNKIETTNS
ncbi:four helix bundle protein [Endozoicomonas euniceicola]|uniref:four helix bundle protein n=1 Tax=Endozoicomonas euniceicola TaxID=1234143 RepID=UPI00384EC979